MSEADLAVVVVVVVVKWHCHCRTLTRFQCQLVKRMRDVIGCAGVNDRLVLNGCSIISTRCRAAIALPNSVPASCQYLVAHNQSYHPAIDF